MSASEDPTPDGAAPVAGPAGAARRRTGGPPAVVMLTNAVAPDKLGGLERYVRELSAALVRAGAAVTVVTKRIDAEHPADETGADGVRILRHDVPDKRNPAFPALYPLQVGGAVRAALADAPDAVVHGHYAITTLAAALTRRRYLYTFHAPVHKEMLSERQGSYRLPRAVQGGAVRSLRAAERLVVNRAAVVVTLSSFMAGELALLAPRAAPGAVSVPGGIDTRWWSPGADDDPWPEAAPLVFTARRLTARTGVTELVAALPAVAARHPGIGLAVAGDGGLRSEVEAEVARLGLTARVRLLGRIGDADLRRWYRRADLAVTPTQQLEGFGLSTAEAMACGTPVWVTPVGANPELVAGLDPLLVGAGATPADLAGGIAAALDHPDRLAALRAEARARVEPDWSWDAVAGRYLELYERLGP